MKRTVLSCLGLLSHLLLLLLVLGPSSLSSSPQVSASRVLLSTADGAVPPPPALTVSSSPPSAVDSSAESTPLSLAPRLSSSAASVYSSPASPPSFVPPARLSCSLTSIDGGNHRALALQLGSPPQLLRLLVDTGSADLLVLNVSYCQRTQSFATHSCFNPVSTSATVTPTVVNPVAFAMGALDDDGEVLTDSAARAAVALANLPLQLQGSNLSVLLGAADVTLQDSLLGYPTAASQGVSVLLMNPSALTTFAPPIPYPTFPYPVSPSYNSLTSIDGYLGLAYNPLSSLAGLNSQLYQSAYLRMTQAIAQEPLATTFALDFYLNRAYFGGINGQLYRADEWRSSLLWTYPGSVSFGSYHSFALFDLSVCGVNLQQTLLQTSEPVSAVVDSGSSCLGLPAELFDGVVSWLPVTCSDSADGLQMGQSTEAGLSSSAFFGGNVYPPVSQSGVGSIPTTAANPSSAGNISPHVRYCWLSADLTVDVLPSLSFRVQQSNPDLADSDPSQPPRLLLPLQDLILGVARPSLSTSSTPQRLCLYRDVSLFTPPPLTPAVTIGGRSLSSLRAVFDMQSHQVAFAQQPHVRASNATCVRPVHCSGQQTHEATYNLCVDPDCSSFYLFTLNRESHQCELTAGFHVIASLAIAVFVAVELGLNEWLISISKRVQGINGAAQDVGGRRSHRR